MKRDEDTGENCTNEAVQIYTTKNATNTKRRRRTNQRRPKSKIGGIDDAHEHPAAAACGENKEHCPSEKRRRNKQWVRQRTNDTTTDRGESREEIKPK